MPDNLALSALSLPQSGVEKLELRRFATAKKPDAAQQFEAFVLQSFVEQMMPKEASSVYGSGLAGDYWKSMLSEKLAGVLAERGDIGIAEYVRKGAGSGTAVEAQPQGRFSAADLAASALGLGAMSPAREDK